jgi:hypothetical protein
MKTELRNNSSSAQLHEAKNSRLASALAGFSAIGLAEMSRVALLDRSEVKYALHMDTLVGILEPLSRNYAVVQVEGHRLNRYRSLYFDTADFAMYCRHHMGARSRYKLRAREYVETKTSFLEIKHKINKRRTVKHRIATPELVTHLEHDLGPFVSGLCPYAVDELAPCLWNSYSRITLVNRNIAERVTLDIDLNYWFNRRAALPGLVIAEVKQQGRMQLSDFVACMHEHRIRKIGFSKFCMGVSLLYPEIKHNKFKSTQRHVARLMRGEHDDNR